MKTLDLVVYRNSYVLKTVIFNLNTAIVMRRRVNLHDLWQKEIIPDGDLQTPVPLLSKDLMQFRSQIAANIFYECFYIWQCVSILILPLIFLLYLNKHQKPRSQSVCI